MESVRLGGGKGQKTRGREEITKKRGANRSGSRGDASGALRPRVPTHAQCTLCHGADLARPVLCKSSQLWNEAEDGAGPAQMQLAGDANRSACSALVAPGLALLRVGSAAADLSPSRASG